MKKSRLTAASPLIEAIKRGEAGPCVAEAMSEAGHEFGDALLVAFPDHRIGYHAARVKALE